MRVQPKSYCTFTFKTPTLSRHRADGSTCSASDIAVSQYARHDQRNLDRWPMSTHQRRTILAGKPPSSPIDIRY